MSIVPNLRNFAIFYYELFPLEPKLSPNIFQNVHKKKETFQKINSSKIMEDYFIFPFF